VHLSVPLLLKMVDEIPNVACIKQEAPPTPQKITALIAGMKTRKVTSMGRLAKPEEQAAAVTFLASEIAGYITGVSLIVDGGAVKAL